MDLVQALLHSWNKDADKVFTNKQGQPIVVDNFRTYYWDRVLDFLTITKRKCYSTRYTFITQCVATV
jgi:hypothetical protein